MSKKLQELEFLAQKFRRDNSLNENEPIIFSNLLQKKNILTVYRPLSSGLSGMSIKIKTNEDRQLIFNKYNGKCAYCGCELQKGWHADHIEPILRDSKWNRDKGKFEQTGTCRKPENETLENYNPACASCNIQKNSFTVEQFRRNIKQFVNSLNQYNTQYKFAKRYGLVTETDIEVKFYFETVCSNDR